MDAKTRAQLDALQKKRGPWLFAADIAKLVETDPQWIRIKGQRHELPYPIDIVGNRVKIYKKSFIAWAEENL